MSRHNRIGFLLLLTLSLVVVACSGQSATNGATGGNTAGGTATPVATTAPTATPKSKPSAVPTTTVALCESWVSIAEANQILSPPAPIATVVPGNSTGISSCQYLDGSSKVPFIVTFEAFPAGTQMSTYASEVAAQTLKGATITINQAVSGVGDQAWYLVGTASSGSLSAHGNVLYVADGGIVIIIENLDFNKSEPLGSSSDTTILSEFIQIGNLIISRF